MLQFYLIIGYFWSSNSERIILFPAYFRKNFIAFPEISYKLSKNDVEISSTFNLKWLWVNIKKLIFLKFSRKFSKLNFVQFSRKISENFGNYFGKFGRIISRNSLKIIRKIIKIKSFRKMWKIILENFGKLPEIFLEISKNINEIFENYFEKIFYKFRKISRIIAENFEILFVKFWEMLLKILKINRKISKIIKKNSGDFEKYFGHFRLFRKN